MSSSGESNQGSTQTLSPPLAPSGSSPASRWITWRSALLGTAAVILVCGLAPYNDYVVANTYMVGSYFPVVVTITFFLLIVLVNAPLHLWLPRWALSSGELAVILGMMLVGCSIPSQGMMRTVVPTLVSPFYVGQSYSAFWDAFAGMKLPGWLYPVPDIASGRTSSIVNDFYGHVQPGEAIPYRAWVIPLAGWGVFFGGLLATLLSLAALLRYQWAANERLPFPLAQIQSALIEAPEPGRALNSLFRSRLFWLAVSGVIFAHALTGLNRYFPRHVPAFPLGFNLSDVLTSEPWIYLGGSVKIATIYFTFIGVSYFIQSRVSFSLWGTFLIVEFFRMFEAVAGYETPPAAWDDQHIGACVAFVGGMLWIGRHHWWRIVRHALGRGRRGEAQGDYGSYRLALLALLLGIAVMLTWLLLLNLQMWVALGIVFFILLAHLATARIVAETGLPFVRTNATFPQVYTTFSPSAMSARDVFFGGVFTINGPFNTRESALTFGLHALQVNDQFEASSRCRGALIGLMAWAAVLGFVVAATSWLYCYYTYALPLSIKVETAINYHATTVLPQRMLAEPLTAHAIGQWPIRSHNPYAHMLIGAVVVLVLQVGALRWASWPLMPVGYVLFGGPFIEGAWFSVFLGWLAKLLILRFGGAKFFQNARPLFIGLIFGEALAAALWMIVSLVLAVSGYEYESIMLLPS